MSPFFGREYSEFEFKDAIYNYLIHPQWDNMGSSTLYLKILYANYDVGFCIIELFGEWNDCLYNDIMYLKRNVAEILCENGISKFILIGENVLNFHSSDTDYYEEWLDDVGDGWITVLNLRDHVMDEFLQYRIDHYLSMAGPLNDVHWRSLTPVQLFHKVDRIMSRSLHAYNPLYEEKPDLQNISQLKQND